MKLKTSELTGVALDWAAAKCEGHGIGALDDPWFAPSTNWAQGGPIIERERLGVWYSTDTVDEEGNLLGYAEWYSETGMTDESADEPYRCMTGDTPLIAAMRCYVARQLGDEVDVPEELK